MRNPRRKRNIGIVSALSGAIAVIIATMYSTETESLLSMLGGVGLTAGIFGVYYAIYAQFETAKYDRLMRGEDVLAQWRVDPHLWRAFARLDDTLNVPSTNPISIPSDSDGLRSDGVRVIIGTSSLMVDDYFHPLPGNVTAGIYGPEWFEGPPPYLEFRLSPQHYSRPSDWWIRVPIGAGAEGDARKVYDYYHSGG
jgi:hypothetical protein